MISREIFTWFDLPIVKQLKSNYSMFPEFSKMANLSDKYSAV